MHISIVCEQEKLRINSHKFNLSFCSRDKSRGTLPSICCYGIYIQVEY
nr:MAG TPA: hypothetical protein [Caudoviricetes sp.]